MKGSNPLRTVHHYFTGILTEHVLMGLHGRGMVYHCNDLYRSYKGKEELLRTSQKMGSTSRLSALVDLISNGINYILLFSTLVKG